jgi:hypothetical protein
VDEVWRGRSGRGGVVIVEGVDVARGRVRARLRRVANRVGECMSDARCVSMTETEVVSEWATRARPCIQGRMAVLGIRRRHNGVGRMDWACSSKNSV